MDDGLNAGEPTDRLFCHWQLSAPAVVAASAGRPLVVPSGGAPVVLDDRGGRPYAAPGTPGSGRVRLRLPADVERLRTEQPELARSWRHALRDVLGPLLDAGRRTEGMTADGELVVGAAPDRLAG